MATFNRTDLDFILKQILLAESGQPPVNPHLAFGLREVLGTNNSAVAGQSTFGSADQVFPTQTVQYFQTVNINIDGTIFDPNPGVAGDTMVTSYASTSPNSIVVDTAPRTISNLISDLSSSNPAAVQTAQAFGAQLGDGYTVFSSNPSGLTLPGPDGVFGTADDLAPADPNNLFIGNITPDAGLSAPFNSWMTFFGQFFDHGLDLITKGGNGTVFIPLLPDDPLYNPAPGAPNFMVLTRATDQNVLAGPDGVLGTSDDIHRNINTVTPFVDQNQTYSSHSSHQVFLRDYQVGVDGRLHSSGKLLQHAVGADGVAGTADDNSGMATWGDVKANALKLGIALTDFDVGNIPLLATDAYGNFIANPLTGNLQFVVSLAGGGVGLVDAGNINPANGPLTAVAIPANAVYTGHAFINDMAHTAAPFAQDGVTHLIADDDTIAGPVPNPAFDPGQPVSATNQPYLAQPAGTYDNELLNAHYIAGDGRANENIALTTVHAIFHDEHNRLIEQTKSLIRAELAAGDTAFALDWVLPGANLADGIQENEWNGERLFQVAKFGTETQYQHLVFEEFARKIAPTIHLFGNVDIHLDPAIVSEFANAVYRFGHSMLDENVPVFQLNADGTMKLGADGQPLLTNEGLIEAFTNPLAFAALGANGAAEIVQGTTHQIGSEIDEFVTGAVRNNLLGLPLDLAALNIARGRDTGVAPLNLVRAQIYAATNDQTLKPYASWTEFRQFLKHDASIVNFLAAYGTHASILAATTLDEKRSAALALVLAGDNAANTDAYNFMHSLGAYANDVSNPIAVHAQWSTGSITGLDNIDLWIGGLAEKQNLFGGLLGSTFNFIFETQLEALQDGDRLYYLPRIEGIHWGSEIEANTFASMIMLNTGAKHLPASIFLTPEYTVEASDYFVKDASGAFVLDANGHRIATDSSTWLRNPVTGALLVEVLPDGTVHFIGDDNFFGNTMVLGGTEGNDRLQAGHADDDTVWGDGGDDWIDGGNGNDQLFGGDGNDTIVDSAGDDVIHGDAGNDTVLAGMGDDIVFGGDGNDYVEGGAGIDDIVGGQGNDILKGGEDDDEILGNEGDDWIEGGIGGDLLNGDQGAPTGDVPWISGNDVLDGGAGGDRMQGFSGDDIMLGLGGFDKFEGRLGYDWADFEQEVSGVSVDMSRREFIDTAPALGGDAIRDFFIETEAVSGSRFGDVLMGTNPAVLDPLFNELTNVDLIFGLASFFPAGPVAFSGGNIMLGGDGSDWIMGRGGNDIIDGDAWLHVHLDGTGGAGSNIVREILYDTTPGDVDTAVYNDVLANYIISAVPDAQGFFTVTQIAVTPGLGLPSDGVDRIRNIERLQFSDQTIVIDTGPNPNRLPTGTVTIDVGDTAAAAGIDPQVGVPVNFSLSTIQSLFDPDGIKANTLMHFQWEVLDPVRLVWIPIAGAAGDIPAVAAGAHSASTAFTPTNFQNTESLRVTVSIVDGKGLTEIVHSAATNPVSPPPGINTAPFIVPQQGLVGLPDTAARTGLPINLTLPLITAFGDHETPSNLLGFTATLLNGQVLDGSAAAQGLLFSLVPDGTGGVAFGTITGTVNTAGPISIRVTVTDVAPVPLSVTDVFVINVLQGNRAPITAANLTLNGALEDVSFSATLPPGVDPDGTTPVFRLVAGSAQHGTVTDFNQTTGAFTFLSAPGFAGQGSFSYTLFDGQLSSGQTTVTINVAPVNDGPAPFKITGVAAVGGTLTGLIGVDPDGPWNPLTASYQWFRNGVAIGPASNSPDYIVTATDVGQSLSVNATYTDGQGFVEHVTSAATAPIGVLEVRALAGAVGAVVSAFNTLVDPDGNPAPDALFYDWAISTDGVNFLPADPALISADSKSLTLPNGAGTAGAVRYVQTTALYVDGANNFDTVTSAAVRVVVGSGVANTFTGDGTGEIFFGLGGVDTINANAGNDTLVGGAGGDTLNGGDGNDRFLYTIGDGADAVNGGNGTDTVVVTGTAANNIFNVVSNAAGLITTFENGTATNVEAFALDLLGGTDTLDFSANAAANGVTVNLAAGTGTGFSSIVNVENVNGGAGADTIVGNAGANVINGNAGDDTITGGAGADTINGGAGADRFMAINNDGADAYVGGGGTDTLDLSLVTAAAVFDLTAGTVTTLGEIDSFTSVEVLVGGQGADRFLHSISTDVVAGGAGSDVFVFATRQAAGNGSVNRDIINDFAVGSDKIDVSGIDSDLRATSPNTQHFIFDGLVAAGTEAVGHMGFHYETLNGVEYTVIEGNVRTGASAAETTQDFQIALLGHLLPTSGDFILGGP